jgi:hypothetical protein
MPSTEGKAYGFCCGKHWFTLPEELREKLKKLFEAGPAHWEDEPCRRVRLEAVRFWKSTKGDEQERRAL